MHQDDPRFVGIDLGSLLEDLFRYAESLFREKTGEENCVLHGTGKCSQDIAEDALTEFILKETAWRPSTPDSAQAELFYFVRTMIRHDFLDLIKDGRAHRRTETIDGTVAHSGELLATSDEDDLLTNFVATVGDDDVLRRAYKSVEGEPELKEYLDCVLRDGVTKCSKVAAQLNIGLPEAIRRRDRLRTRLTPWKRALMAEKASRSRAA